MLNKNIEQDLQEYIIEHAIMQLNCYNLSTNADRLGYPGFSHYFQVQSQDEILHQRRIMNFVMARDGHYQVENIATIYKTYDNLTEIVTAYKVQREHFAEITNKYAKNSQVIGDLVANKFYDWFLIDFYEELAEIKDILDWIKMSNGDYYDLDRKMLKRMEPDTLLVIDPFSPHA